MKDISNKNSIGYTNVNTHMLYISTFIWVLFTQNACQNMRFFIFCMKNLKITKNEAKRGWKRIFGACTQTLAEGYQVLFKRGTMSLDHLTFDRKPFDPGRLSIVSDFGSIRVHSIEISRANVGNTKIDRKSGNLTVFNRMSNDRAT